MGGAMIRKFLLPLMLAASLAACDGGTSTIRKALGIRYNGRGKMRANVSFYFRSRDFLAIHGKGLGNLYFVFAPDSFGVFTAIDGKELWSFQYYFLDPSRSTESIDAAEVDRKSTRLNSSHIPLSRMPSSA